MEGEEGEEGEEERILRDSRNSNEGFDLGRKKPTKERRSVEQERPQRRKLGRGSIKPSRGSNSIIEAYWGSNYCADGFACGRVISTV